MRIRSGFCNFMMIKKCCHIKRKQTNKTKPRTIRLKTLFGIKRKLLLLILFDKSCHYIVMFNEEVILTHQSKRSSSRSQADDFFASAFFHLGAFDFSPQKFSHDGVHCRTVELFPNLLHRI